MSRSSLSWPVSILAGFAIFVVLLLVGALDATPAMVAVTGACPTTSPQYPGCNQTAVAQTQTQVVINFNATADAGKTAAVLAATSLAQRCVEDPAYPRCSELTPENNDTTNGDNTGNNNNTNNDNSGNANQQPTATSTFTPTATRAVTGTATTQPADNNQPPTPTLARSAAPAEEGQSTATTSTPALPAGVSTIACIPGETVELAGETAPNTPLLLFFGERPVGGGVSSASGAYRLRLQVGNERPGLYLVEVRERVGRTLVDQYGCEVPAFTPTPTPAQ